jgi:predicted transcriptional regulator
VPGLPRLLVVALAALAALMLPSLPAAGQTVVLAGSVASGASLDITAAAVSATVDVPSLDLQNPTSVAGGLGVSACALDACVTAGAPAPEEAGAASSPASEPAASAEVPSAPPSQPAWEQAAAPALGAVVAAALIGLAAKLALPARLLQGLAGLPLFSRILGPRVLDQPTRQAIHQFIATHPGASIQEIRRGTGVAWGTAVHHLRRLESSGQVVAESHGAERLHWLAHSTPHADRAGLAELRHPARLKLARAIAAHPGEDQGGLAAISGMSAASASKHVSALERACLVERTPVGRRTHVTPTEGLQAALDRVDQPGAVRVGKVLTLRPQARASASTGLAAHNAPLF